MKQGPRKRPLVHLAEPACGARFAGAAFLVAGFSFFCAAAVAALRAESQRLVWYLMIKLSSTSSASGSGLASCPWGLLALVVGRHEPDRPLGRLGRGHQLAQSVEDLLELIAGIAAKAMLNKSVFLAGQRASL